MNIKNVTLPLALIVLAGCSKAPQPTPAPATAPAADAAAAPVTAAAPPTLDADVAPADVLALTQAEGGPLLLDVRSPEEFAAGHVPGAMHIPVDDLAARLPEIEAYRERGVVTYCKSGRRAAAAVDTLKGAGFAHVRRMDGSMDRWIEEGRPVEMPAAK